MATFSRIAIDEPTTVDKNAATVQMDRGGTLEEQEIIVIGDCESTVAIARVSTGVPSTHAGLITRSLTYQSSQADNRATVYQSTAGDLNVTAAQGGTWNIGTVTTVSSLAGIVTVGEYSTAAPAANSTGLVVRIASPSTGPFQMSSLGGRVEVGEYSTATPATGSTGLIVRVASPSTGPFQMSSLGGVVNVQQNSTVWQGQVTIKDSSGVNVPASTALPVNGAVGLHVRQVYPTILSTAFSTIGNGSTSSTVVSSAAGVRHKVFAYSITSTVQAVNSLSFASGLSNVIWTMQHQSVSSGISGANLAVTPPAWLFATAAAEPLVFKITGSTGSYHLSFSYFSEA